MAALAQTWILWHGLGSFPHSMAQRPEPRVPEYHTNRAARLEAVARRERDWARAFRMAALEGTRVVTPAGSKAKAARRAAQRVKQSERQQHELRERPQQQGLPLEEARGAARRSRSRNSNSSNEQVERWPTWRATRDEVDEHSKNTSVGLPTYAAPTVGARPPGVLSTHGLWFQGLPAASPSPSPLPPASSSKASSSAAPGKLRKQVDEAEEAAAWPKDVEIFSHDVHACCWWASLTPDTVEACLRVDCRPFFAQAEDPPHDGRHESVQAAVLKMKKGKDNVDFLDPLAQVG
jgi:hypothetical protein